LRDVRTRAHAQVIANEGLSGHVNLWRGVVVTHRSRLAALVIDCRGDDLAEAMRFWSGALGTDFYPDPDDARYAVTDRAPDEPHLLLQKVEHDSRVHLDIETDDREAERARLEALGARLVERHPKGHIIMQAPTGQRFCLVAPQHADFAETAREHD
jgi:predicted enzyme related to lactoylglutathione lyase